VLRDTRGVMLLTRLGARLRRGSSGSREVDVADLRLLDAVVGADRHLVQRQAPERVVAERGHRDT
jgi:hypothetical protein